MISVQHLTKTFSLQKGKSGAFGFIRNIFNKEYEVKTAVNDISFDIDSGELVGFLGPNGAGKTTTMKMLSGILYPTGGNVKVLGYTPFDKDCIFLKNISFIMGQRGQLMWELPVMDTLKLNKAIYEVSDKDFKKTVYEMADLLGARKLLYQVAKTLSLGQRMKMELIAGLVHRPKVLFLDEPTIGLDVVAQKIIRDFIEDYQRMYDATILLTSHYMEDVKRLAKRVVIIDQGSIIYDGSLDTLIRKFAPKKTIEVVVDIMPKTTDLEKVGGMAKVNFPKITYQVDRNKAPEFLHTISKHIQFVDITIEEEKVENIVRKIFEKTDAAA